MSAIALDLADGRTISGHCDPQFTGVLTEFRRNFEERKEQGASVAITHHGRTVVDLWGGTAKPDTGEAWGRDTVSIVYSCTKAATALCLHMLVDQGKVSYDTLVGDIWPAFATGGKEATTVGMMLAHTSPVPHVAEPIRKGGLADWDYMTARVAAEPAHWEPGTQQGYHGVTYAWTVGQLVRLVSGMPLGQFFREHVTGPLGLDFHIGLSESEEHRVAPMIGRGELRLGLLPQGNHAAGQPAQPVPHQPRRSGFQLARDPCRGDRQRQRYHQCARTGRHVRTAGERRRRPALGRQGPSHGPGVRRDAQRCRAVPADALCHGLHGEHRQPGHRR